MKLRSFIVSLAIGLSLLCASVGAEAAWQHNLSHRNVSGKTSIKIIGLDGARVSVSIDGTPKEDTIPAIINLPDRDMFLPVTVTAADGQKFDQKIEIKARQQAELVVTYTPDAKAPAPAAAPGRKFIGRTANFSSRCKDADRWELRLDFLRTSDGSVLGSSTLKLDGQQSLELPGGSYDVRMYGRRAGATTDFGFMKTLKMDVDADDWLFAYGCRARGEAPGRITKSDVK